jgi:prevent-host-death family protein
MEEAVTAAEANRKFSRLLRGVSEGKSYVVTSHGRPVARLMPMSQSGNAGAKKRLLDRLRAQPALNAGPWTRDELYDD